MHYGIDIGGTKIELAIYDNQFNLLDAWREPTPVNNYHDFLSLISKMVKIADHNINAQGTVGIGFPGIISNQCVIAANIPCIHNQPVIDDLSQLINRSVSIENDVNALIISETFEGAASGHDSALAVVLGTGVAGGLWVNNTLHTGAQNSACEFGHTPLSALVQQRYKLPLLQCGCGLIGCNEQYISGPGLLNLCKHMNTNYQSTLELIDDLQKNSADAIKVMNAYIDILGSFFAQLILSYDPNIIVLGGGLSNIKTLYSQLPQAIQPYLFKGINVPDIVPAQFGDSSGVRGAAIIGQQAQT